MESSTGEDVARLDAREQAHVLDEDGINTEALELSNKTQRILPLIVIDEGVDSDVDGGAKLVGIGTELGNVVKTIASSLSCTKTGCANIDGVSTMVYCSHSTSQILGRGEEFYRLHV